MSKNQKTIYKLGRVAFSLKHADKELLSDFDILLPRNQSPDSGDAITVAFPTFFDVRSLQNHILAQHQDLLWLDAGCLISPTGKKVLIVGRSSAGKSTTTMALALGYDWKVIAEDILLVDLQLTQLITFGAPFSLKKGTLQLLQDCIGKVPQPIVHGEWSPMGAMAAYGPHEAHFDVAIIFGSRSEFEGLTVRTISPSEYLRKILPSSNLLRLNEGSEKFLKLISTGICVEIENGSLRERLDKIMELSQR